MASADWRSTRSLEPIAFTDTLMDAKMQSQFRQRFDDLNRNYEWRERFSLTTQHDQEVRLAQSASFAMSSLSEVQAAQLKRGLEEVKEGRAAQYLMHVNRTSASIIATAAALNSGVPMRAQTSAAGTLTLRCRAYAGTGSLEYSHPEISTSVTYSAGGSFGRASSSDGERLALHATKPLRLADLTSGMSYGSTSGLMTASLSRPILPHLAAVADTSWAMSPGASVDAVAQERLSLLYQLSF